MKKIVMTISLVALVLIAFQAMAHPPVKQGNPNPGWGQALTQEQRAKVDTLRQQYMRDTLETRKNLMAKRLELRTLMAQPNVDAQKARALHDEMMALRNQLQKRRFDFRLAVRKIVPTAGTRCGMWEPGNGPGMNRSGWGQHSPMGRGMGMGYGGGYGRGHGGFGGCPGCF